MPAGEPSAAPVGSVRHAHRGELAGSLHGQRAQPDRVQELEDRGVRPDAERQRQNRDEGEGRVQTQRRRPCRRSFQSPAARPPGSSAPGAGGAAEERSTGRSEATSFLRSSSSRTERSASGSETPRAMSSSYRSPACCASSSTIDASRAGSRRSSASRSRMVWRQSGMLRLRDPFHRPDEAAHALRCSRSILPSGGRDPVVAPSPLRRPSRPSGPRSARGARAGRAAG